MLEFEVARNPQAIAEEINAIKERTRDAVISGAIEIGKRLCEAKELLPVGSWGEWLKANVDYSERTAQNLMSIYNEYGKKGIPSGLAQASLTNALALIGLPEDIKHELIDSGEAESLSTRELKAEIERLKQEKADAQVTIDSLLGAQEDAKEKARAAGEQARQAEKDAQSAREAAMAATEKAMAERDKNEGLERDMQALRAQYEAAKAEVAIEPAVIEKVPDDVLRELAELRALAKENRSASEILFRDAWGRMVETFKTCQELAEQVSKESGEAKGTQLLTALGKVLRQMADKLGG